jgi:hypothetical protein
MVPWSASSNLPGFSLVAPVKAPRSWPNSSDSRSSLGKAAQLILTNGLPRRGDRSCSVRAMPSFPTPLSPRMRTGTSVSATRSTMSQMPSIAGLEATKSAGTPRRGPSAEMRVEPSTGGGSDGRADGMIGAACGSSPGERRKATLQRSMASFSSSGSIGLTR